MFGMDSFFSVRAQRAASFSTLCGALMLAACGSTDGTAAPGSSGGSTASSSGAGAIPVAGAGGNGSIAGAGSGGSLPSAGAAGSIVGTGGSAGAIVGAAAGAGGLPAIAGAGGGGSVAGAAGVGGKTPVCAFANGLNVAWVKFANDVPNPDLPTFKTVFKNNYDAGGRIVRWWFHTNGTVTPGYGSDGKASAIPQSHIDGVKALLSAANDAGVALVISLWSFDMMQDNAGAAYVNNQALLEKDENRQAYVDRYLTPLVTALKGSKGLYAYEIFNEPEGMGPNGWATHRTTLPAIQKTVNWLAAAIHTADPNVLVTTSAQTFDTCSKIGGKTNLYSDAALRTAGDKENGTLDFYQVHYYTVNGISNSAFQHPASYWGLDKKLVMGEFHPDDTDGVVAKDLGKYLYENGYSGAWYWSVTDRTWPLGQSTLQTLYAAHSDVANCPLK